MADPRRRKAEADLQARAGRLRAKGYTYALIERELGIPYLQARELASKYDARHGKPKRIVRTAPTTLAGTDIPAIPVRDLRNDAARILRQVEKGKTFLITVSGRIVAEIGPPRTRLTFVPRSVLESIIREAPLDPGFAADVDDAVDQRVDEI